MAEVREESESPEEFETRLRIMLPDQYQDSYNDVQSVSMGSASLKFHDDGKVAWGEIWGSFCDLAMAGGPPHKGTLLEPGAFSNILALPDRYDAVLSEICRGIDLVTGLVATPSSYPGWISVDCTSTGQAGWLARAIMMENVSADQEGMVLYLPAGPYYRLEKEIKNVITVVAKTCHYWFEHTSLEQRRSITKLLSELETRSPLIRPVFPGAERAPLMDQALYNSLVTSVHAATRFRCSVRAHGDWLGVEFQDIKPAIWLMRTLVVGNVFARREHNVVFAAVNPIIDPGGESLARRLIWAYRYGVAQNIFR